ncbi:MAG: glycosyltransferase family 2 protein [Candidatus Omnitrophica bacterium]|nr:glycosyltransferase family 2 protein [Candidatus Omnitrophota bacterium]
MPLLSVIVPVYNEVSTISKILEKINAVDIDMEIIVVNDGSYDGTENVLRNIKYNNLKVIHHSKNRGKGAAFLTGLANTTGEYVIIQDADLEYNPNEFPGLIEVIKTNKADIVLGARFLKGHHGLLMHSIGNRILTALLNFLFKSRLNDYATCYKLAKKSTWDDLKLKAAGFDIEVEIICNILKNNKSLLEVPIFYTPRTYKSGKKIRFRDGFWAVFYMFKYRFA